MMRRQVATLSKNISAENIKIKGAGRAASKCDLGPASFTLSPWAVNYTLNGFLCKWRCSSFYRIWKTPLLQTEWMSLCLFFPSIRQLCVQVQPSGRHGGGVIATELFLKLRAANATQFSRWFECTITYSRFSFFLQNRELDDCTTEPDEGFTESYSYLSNQLNTPCSCEGQFEEQMNLLVLFFFSLFVLF